MNQHPKRTALRAWARSSWICIPASPAILIIWELFESGVSEGVGSAFSQIGLFFAIAGVAAVVHFLAFVAVGLPLFFRFHPAPGSRLWKWPSGIAIGVVIGASLLPFVLAILYGRPIDYALTETAAVGALYGGITAIACLLNRPNVEQVGAPNPATRLESEFEGG